MAKKYENFRDVNSGKLLSRPQSTKFYFKAGLTWTYATTSPFVGQAIT